jgi:hypothetical protein
MEVGMNSRTLFIVVAAVVIVIAIGMIWRGFQPQQPAVQISTDAAKVSIGSGGVSISVASSAQ